MREMLNKIKVSINPSEETGVGGEKEPEGSVNWCPKRFDRGKNRLQIEDYDMFHLAFNILSPQVVVLIFSPIIDTPVRG
ncbi:hypothetical protein TNCV_2484541 [Trichonephila clavipes]|uniref:Uncharacterized protein n=1 Tax=Trichonephila clavipes TaxID=2585209 RepID=A0A8X6VZM0_TRICX|nr:hypothetical protein TNCV_2484541 [Trichonephila clavipes]